MKPLSGGFVLLASCLTLALPVSAQPPAPVVPQGLKPIAPPVSNVPVPLGVGEVAPVAPGVAPGVAPVGEVAIPQAFTPLGQSTSAIPSVPSASPGTALSWTPSDSRCITALAQEPNGTMWVGTEDAGVWRYDPSAPTPKRWKQFTAQDGLGDNSAYALCIDKQGRLWVGTLNHGVSVWNGEKWKNYGLLDGPIGERVFAIKVCPTNGELWIATNAGLSRYSAKNDSWSSLTRAGGLPSDQVQAIAFDQEGNVVLGTQCDGLALAQAQGGYRTWRQVKGPDRLLLSPIGQGLPSGLINDVLVAKDGTIYTATTEGLAWSTDRGSTWSFVRGQDYADKVRGRFDGPPLGWEETPGAVLTEDYVSCLAEDGGGRIWLGHWRLGDEAVQMQPDATGTKLPVVVSTRPSAGFVKALLPQDGSAPLVARYDEGLSYGGSSPVSLANSSVSTVTAPSPLAEAPMPSPAKAPTLAQLNTLLASLGQIEPLDSKAAVVAPLPDDWATQGDWLGRYGRYWVSLSAMVSPDNYYWGGGWTPIGHAFGVSPKQKDDALRYWVHRLQTDDPRSLEMPPTYLDSRLQMGLTTKSQYRRQSELDDHGEVYPLTKEGPNIYSSVKIPAGLWILSLYNVNKDGHEDLNRARDYTYSIRPHDAARPIRDVSDFDAQPELAHVRQRDFWGGVYKRFLVRGPQQLTVEIAKNNSFNTLLAGAFLDLVDEQPPPYFGTVASWRKQRQAREQGRDQLIAQDPQKHKARFAPAADEKGAAHKLFVEIERLRESNPLVWAQRSRPIYEALARWTQAALVHTNPDKTSELTRQKGTCLYWLNCYNGWEDSQRQEGLIPARDTEKALKWDGESSGGEGFQVINKQRHVSDPEETP